MNFINSYRYVQPVVAGGFETRWTTTSVNEVIELPYKSNGTYTGTIDWGDGSTPVANTYANRSHTYATAGDYNIIIDGECSHFDTQSNTTSRDKLKEVLGFGTYTFSTLRMRQCSNLIGGPNCRDTPIINSGDSGFMFYNNTNMITFQHIEDWDWTNVPNPFWAFMNCQQFVGDLSNWDMSNCLNISYMFYNCYALNFDASGWDLSNCTRVNQLFSGMYLNFNSDAPFDLTSVTSSAYSLFYNSQQFNGDLTGMDTSTLTRMDNFIARTSFNNSSINTLDVSSNQNFKGFFTDIHTVSGVSFNQDLTNWNTSSATNMETMFKGNDNFNGDISGFDTGLVTTMKDMFSTCYNFNRDISSWNVSNVDNFDKMFYSADAFNQNISSWNTSSATNMYRMFYNCNNFDQPIGSWDVGNVTNMESMFQLATDFDQDLSNWDLSSITNMAKFMDNRTHLQFSSANYDNLLDACVQGGQLNVTLGMGTIKYTTAGQTRRNTLVSRGWTITDGGLV
jgi:surface protein